MSVWLVTAAILLQVGLQSDLPAARSPASPDATVNRRAVLKDALAKFDQAVAMKGRSTAQAQQLYREALTGFESLLHDGVRNGGLYYNAANAYLRLGQVGRAVVNYRRAQRLMPGTDQVSRNLQSARRMCRVQVARPATSAFVETLFFWHFGTSPALRMKVALGCYVLFWALMLARLLVFRRTVALTWSIRVVLAVTLVVGASVGWEVLVQSRQVEGVVVADQVVLRKGNGEYYEPQLEQALSDGMEFRLLDSRKDVEGAIWYYVELVDGKKGWLRANQAEVI